jgi:YVTN family beta-propeller protein
MDRPSYRLSWWLAAWVALVCLGQGGCVITRPQAAQPSSSKPPAEPFAGEDALTPTGQRLTPAGRQVELPGMRPQALALSPNGRWLAAAGKKSSLAVIDPASGRVVQRVPLAGLRASVEGITNTAIALAPKTAAARKPPRRSTRAAHTDLSLTGLAFAPDGHHLYLAAVGGTVQVFTIGPDNVVGRPSVLVLPPAHIPKPKRELPSGLAVSLDGQRLYVAGNLGNKLYELDPGSGTLLRSWDTGVAPSDVVLAAGKAYVSNLGGSRPQAKDRSAPAGEGAAVRVDERGIAREGSVTIIDLLAGRPRLEIAVEQHASALAASPDGRYVVVANTGGDTLSVIDTRSDRVAERIWARQTPADGFGAQPNALAFDASGRFLFVCNGTQNAVAVIRFEPHRNASKVVGLIPVGWFPGAVTYDGKRRALYVANIKGAGPRQSPPAVSRAKFNSKRFTGSISLVPRPSEQDLATLTELALQNLRYPRLAEARLPARPDQPARPVPERAGEPSVFKHVIYVIKENRSYDQVLGDMPEGNGDPRLCTFGETFTPNQHHIAREFVLLDNMFCSGILSADGHQWTDSAIANEYIERQLTAGFPRSYPGGKVEAGADALAWASSGFLWDNALAHGRTFRNYGEWMISDAGWARQPPPKAKPHWHDFWADHLNGTRYTRIASHAGLASLGPHSATNTVGWDLNVPDVVRAEAFIRELKQFETNGGFPNLELVFLPNDHTGGTRGLAPTPAAQIADNDLAFGRLVEALTHSRFWPQTCLLAIEDHPQAGSDHVSGYRTTCYVVSPYTKRRPTISAPYNQISLVRTIELILGLPPMNQMDAAASPMTDCFTDQPDLTPFHCQPNRIPLDQINPEPRHIRDPILRKNALTSARLPWDEPDRCPENVLNRILWHAQMGSDVPFPEWAVHTVDDRD